MTEGVVRGTAPASDAEVSDWLTRMRKLGHIIFLGSCTGERRPDEQSSSVPALGISVYNGIPDAQLWQWSLDHNRAIISYMIRDREKQLS
jgi:hypothetical protein